MKSKRDILKERDMTEYSGFTSDKAIIAREVAKRCEYFLPYFEHPNSGENDDIIGYIFGLKVMK